jgi:hypothetical protein
MSAASCNISCPFPSCITNWTGAAGRVGAVGSTCPEPDVAVLISAAFELRRLMSRERVLELQAIPTLGRRPVVSWSIEREATRLTSRRDRSDFVLHTKAAGLARARVKLHVLFDRMISGRRYRA